MVIMNTTRRWPGWCLAGLGLAFLGLSGCQTWVAGMTLPSPWYLQHPPQYITPSPPFPLPRELAAQEAVAAQAVPGAVAPLPPAVPVPAGPPVAGPPMGAPVPVPPAP
jgi:hypothetical protein